MNAPSNAPSICIPHGKSAMHGRTDGRTNGEAWLSTRDLLTFRNARVRIRRFPSADFPTKSEASR